MDIIVKWSMAFSIFFATLQMVFSNLDRFEAETSESNDKPVQYREVKVPAKPSEISKSDTLVVHRVQPKNNS